MSNDKDQMELKEEEEDMETAVQKGKTALRVDVANAVRRLWKVDADGRIPAWAPGTTAALSAPA